MRLLIIFILGLFVHSAYAEKLVQVCTGPNGAKYYENSSTIKKNCRKVESDALSVIPTTSRSQQRLPISIGMSQAQVQNNWGKPLKITKMYTRSGMTEQWDYKGGMLTFSNGVLEVIEQ
jgi:hypothetical protein